MRRSTPGSKSSPGTRAAFHIVLAIWFVCVGFVEAAVAEVRVSGTASSVRLEARGATLGEILQALRTSFKFQYRGTAALHRATGGTYSGSLQHVVADLLTGHDYVMRQSADDLEVIFFDPAGDSAPKQEARPAGPEPLKECRYKGVPVEC
jgi:hypothetical protein